MGFNSAFKGLITNNEIIKPRNNKTLNYFDLESPYFIRQISYCFVYGVNTAHSPVRQHAQPTAARSNNG